MATPVASHAAQHRTERIAHDPRILGGEPVIAGTRTSVRSIVLAAREYGSTAGVLAAYPHLSTEDVAEALAYYQRHQAEVDGYIARNGEPR